jgi:hypothetical protein
MAKSPKRPEEIFQEITDDYRQAFGADLVSLILYGSGAGEDYLPGQSDLNFLVTLTEAGVGKLDRALGMVGRWQKRGVAVPLFMTAAFIRKALDAYPIEFINMKRRYVVVYGEDPLAGLGFDPAHVRLQLERELRGKLLHLRSGYLATDGSARRLRELIAASLTAFVSLMGALLHLRGEAIPAGRREVIAAAAGLYGFDGGIFLRCESIRSRTDRYSNDEVQTVFIDYLKEVGRLCETVDRMAV